MIVTLKWEPALAKYYRKKPKSDLWEEYIKFYEHFIFKTEIFNIYLKQTIYDFTTSDREISKFKYQL